MKVLNKLVVGAAALVLLTACGPTKVSYDKFHEKAVEAAKIENGYTKAVVNGKAKFKEEGKTVEYTFDKIEFTGYTNGRLSTEAIAKAILTIKSEVEASAFAMTVATAEAMTNVDKATYYINGFQVKAEKDGEKTTISYDKNGLPTSIKFSGDSSGSVKISWSK